MPTTNLRIDIYPDDLMLEDVEAVFEYTADRAYGPDVFDDYATDAELLNWRLGGLQVSRSDTVLMLSEAEVQTIENDAETVISSLLVRGELEEKQ